ncbi:MAG: hypothetical protein ABI398_09390 [Devosia sp.]
MLPRVMVRVRKVVRRLRRRGGDESVLSGVETEARWQAMISEIGARDREVERRLARAETALNRLKLN